MSSPTTSRHKPVQLTPVREDAHSDSSEGDDGEQGGRSLQRGLSRPGVRSKPPTLADQFSASSSHHHVLTAEQTRSMRRVSQQEAAAAAASGPKPKLHTEADWWVIMPSSWIAYCWEVLGASTVAAWRCCCSVQTMPHAVEL